MTTEKATTETDFNTIEDTTTLCEFISSFESFLGKACLELKNLQLSDLSQVTLSKFSLIFFEESANWKTLMPISVYHIDPLSNVGISENSSHIVLGFINQVLSNLNGFDFTRYFSNSFEKLESDDNGDFELSNVIQFFDLLKNEDNCINILNNIGKNSYPRFILSLINALKTGIGTLNSNLNYAAERHIIDKLNSTDFILSNSIRDLSK